MIATALVAVALTAVTFAAPATAAETTADCTADKETLGVQEAIDAAPEGCAVVVHDNGQSIPIRETVTIDKSVDLCRGGPTEGTTTEVTVQDSCPSDVDDAPVPVLDASGQGVNVIKVTADDVTIRGLELRWSVQTEDLTGSGGTEELVDTILQTQQGLVGVVVDADNVHLVDNTVEVKGGPCAFASPTQICETTVVPAIGVFVVSGSSDTVIQDNLIRAPLTTDGTVGGAVGVAVSGSNYLIADNEITNWARAGIAVSENSGGGQIGDDTAISNFLTHNRVGIHVEGVSGDAAPTIQNNGITQSIEAGIVLEEADDVVVEDNGVMPGVVPGGTGLWIQGAQDVDVDGNRFDTLAGNLAGVQPSFAVTVSSGSGDVQPTGLVFRDNAFELNPDRVSTVTFRVTSDVQMTTIDVRSNFWCEDTWDGVGSRIQDEGVNRIKYLPFLTSPPVDNVDC